MSQDREILIEEPASSPRILLRRFWRLLLAVVIIVAAIAAAIVTALSQNHGNTHGGGHDSNVGGQKPQDEIVWMCSSNSTLNESWAKSMCRDVANVGSLCSNFEQYACGGWKKRTAIPNGLYSWERFMENGQNIFRTIKERFDSGEIFGYAEKKAKMFFDQCMAETRYKRAHTLQSFTQYLTEIKGSELKSASYINLLPRILPKVNEHGVWPFFKLLTRIHPDNPKRWILSIGPGASPFSEGLTKTLQLTTPKKSHVIDRWLLKSKLLSPDEDVASSGVEKMLNLLKAENMLLLKNVWQMTDDRDICSTYYELGMECPYQSKLLKAVNQLLKLEVDITLAVFKGLNSSKDGYARKIPNKVVTVDYLVSKCSSIDWRDYFKRLANNWSFNETEILLLDETAVLGVCEVVSNYSTYSDRNTLINYLLFSLAKELMIYYDLGLLIGDDKYTNEDKLYFNTNHWYQCMIHTNEALGMATGSIYIRTIPSADIERSMTDIKDIVSYVKKAYRTHILNGPWLDDVTKNKAQRKIDLMVEKIGYPTAIINTTHRDELYSELQVKSDWFNSLVQWKKFAVKQKIDVMLKPVDRTRWILTPATVNAEHDMVNNDINIPISLFQLPFYKSDRPMVMNFGAFGSVIGHEITHAFGKMGSFFDEHGIMRDWLSIRTEKRLKEKSQCLINQYARFNINGYRANPNLTIDEDISDTVGIRTAYYAYKLWAAEHEEKFDNKTESWMKKSKLTKDSLFFIAFSQNFCEKFNQKGLESLSGTHSPGPFRITGSLSDSSVFQKTFSCPESSPYVFKNRCHVW